jgi:hypothetical protein
MAEPKRPYFQVVAVFPVKGKPGEREFVPKSWSYKEATAMAVARKLTRTLDPPASGTVVYRGVNGSDYEVL